MDNTKKHSRLKLSLPYIALGISTLLLLMFVFKWAHIKNRLSELETQQNSVEVQAAEEEKLMQIDSMLMGGQYERALQEYTNVANNKDLQRVTGIELRIGMAQQLVKMRKDTQLTQKVEALRDSIDSVQVNRTALPEEIRSYDSLSFALEKSKVQLANLKRKLDNRSMGEYLTFTNTKGSKMHYVGQVKNNKANGFGVAILNTGSRYQGEWYNNQRHGEGSFYWADGEYYVGSYQNDKRNGTGTYYWPNGEKYVGQWKDDKRNGEGVFYASDGSVITSGVWEEDKLAKNSEQKKNRR